MAEAGEGRQPGRPHDFTLLSDEPSVEDDDPLGFAVVAAKLADTILRSRGSTPFSLGVEGGWGTGKSSLMARLRADLDAHESVTTVWFNAWSARGSSAFEGLIKTVLEQLDPSSLRRAARNRRLIGSLRVGGLVLAGLLRVDRVVEVVWERASVDARTRNELRSVLHDAVESWRADTGGLEPERLLVVFVDDLDRAEPTQVFEIFEAIKLYLDTPGFVFVLGYDQSVISDAVLAEKKYSHAVTGREYVEKIVQVGYRMSPPDDTQAERLMTRYTERSGTAALFDAPARAIVIDRNRRNPRRIKRFLNSFVLLYALDTEWQDLGPEALVEVLLLDMYFPDFMALFWYRAEQDPVTEFLQYRDRRLAALGRAGEADVEALLHDLERTLPEQFPFWVKQLDFIGLVESMRDSPRWEEVRRKLERRERRADEALSKSGIVESWTLADEVATGDAGGAVYYDDGWGGRTRESAVESPSTPHLSPPLPAGRLLWITASEHRSMTTEAAAAAEAHGWDVAISAQPLSLARHLLTSRFRPRQFDVLILTYDQYEDTRAMVHGLDAIRAFGFRGPVVFYSLRATPERRELAESVGGSFAGSPSELLSVLATMPERPKHDAG